MTPAMIIRNAAADGVTISVSATGTIKATGECEEVWRWLETIRNNKAELLQVLRNEMPRLEPMSAEEERIVSAWLTKIGERDPEIFSEVIQRCKKYPDAKRYFLLNAWSDASSCLKRGL